MQLLFISKYNWEIEKDKKFNQNDKGMSLRFAILFICYWRDEIW